MSSGVDSSKVEADQLLYDLFHRDLPQLVGQSGLLGLLDGLVVLPHLLDVVLDEVLFVVLLELHSVLDYLRDDLSDLDEVGLQFLVLLGEVHRADLLPEEQGEQDVLAGPRSVEHRCGEVSEGDGERDVPYLLADRLF